MNVGAHVVVGPQKWMHPADDAYSDRTGVVTHEGVVSDMVRFDDTGEEWRIMAYRLREVLPHGAESDHGRDAVNV